jgi:hypothetical protein
MKKGKKSLVLSRRDELLLENARFLANPQPCEVCGRKHDTQFGWGLWLCPEHMETKAMGFY